MSKSSRVSVRDMRRVFRLLGDIRDLRRDPEAWRVRMIDGLCDLLHARQGNAIAYGDFVPGGDPRVIQSLIGGDPDSAAMHFWMEYVQHHAHERDPVLKETTFRTRRIYAGQVQNDLLDSSHWFGSEWYNELCRPCGVDDALVSFFREKPDVIQGIALHRPQTNGTFMKRDLDLLSFFNRELYLMWRDGLIDSVSSDQSERAQLSRRQREVLKQLLDGKSERCIAKALHISPHTVHTHVKAIYKAYGVNSRAELLARCLGTRR